VSRSRERNRWDNNWFIFRFILRAWCLDLRSSRCVTILHF
jgi:hypothetical protein